MLKTLLLTSLSGLALCQNTPSLTAALASNPDLSQLTSLIGGQPALAQALAGASNITVLAPSNAAISALLNSTAGKAAAADPAAVAAILSYHVLQGTYYAAQIGELAFIPTLLKDTAYANVTGGQRVGVAAAGGSVSFFSGLLQNSSVVAANQNFTGGTIHTIDHVLTLPASIPTTLTTAGLTSLYDALNTTNLLSAVAGLKDVTIFAPANAAFAAIGSALPSLSPTDLAGILTYHVVNGSHPIYSSDLLAGATTVGTLQGGKLTVRVRDTGVFVNGAKVIVPNVLVAGGVVHVIDNVLNPANASATVPESATVGAPAFAGASSVSSAPFASGAPTTTGQAGNVVSQSGAAAAPMRTGVGVVGAGALFGAVWVNL